MNPNPNILLIGFGSIGRRHYQNLLAEGCDRLSVFDPDANAFKGNQINHVERIEEESVREFDIVFVCSPTYLHVEHATICAQAGCHLFVEKPLSHTLEGVSDLMSVCDQKQVISMVGCNLRFEPAIKKMKSLVDGGEIGKLYAMYLEYGRYLPYQRSQTDYRKIYAGKKRMGGGIVLDDIHDVDLLLWFSRGSRVEKASVFRQKVSDLEIDVEDIASIVVGFENGMVGNVRCDYLQQYKHRNVKIVGEKANLVWEFRENVLWRESYTSGTEVRQKIEIEDSNYDANAAYRSEIRYFLNCVASGQDTFHNVRDAASELRLVLS